MNKPFKCPNCGEEMYLDKQNVTITGNSQTWGYYDKWSCEDCCHIEVLDYRSDTNE